MKLTEIKEKSNDSIDEFLASINVTNYVILPDGTVKVNENVVLDGLILQTLPIKFKKVTGNFYCSCAHLITLKGAPDSVSDDFYCSNNYLTSLEGGPSSVGRDYICYQNKLTTLEGAPRTIKMDFYCFDNYLTSLKGAPDSVSNDFICRQNTLTSLEGAPAFVGGDFDCSSNKLTSLHDVHKHLKKVNGNIVFTNNKITRCVLGLILIDGNPSITLDNKDVQRIINRHVGTGKAGVLAAQQELIDADLEDYAEL